MSRRSRCCGGTCSRPCCATFGWRRRRQPRIWPPTPGCRVIRGLGRFRGDGRAFRAWVFTVARWRAIDWRRQAGRRPTNLVSVEQLAERPAPDDPVAAVLEAQSTRAALALLAELPPDQADVVALRVLGGLEVAEVARIVGKRPGAVRVLAHRGLRRLAKRMEAAGLARGVTR